MIKDKLERLAACIVYFAIICLFIGGVFLSVYLVLYTRYWYITVIYYIWAWIIDKDTPEQKGRPISWFRSMALFKYARNYFPIKVHYVPGFNVEKKRNYLCCLFPHGFMPIGGIVGYVTNACGTHNMFANHAFYGTSLKILFNVALVREYLLSIGMCCASSKGLGYLLSRPEGGNVVGLVVGGASEMFYCHGGQYRLTLKNRKGFAKIALTYGAPLIPIFLFGETSVYKQMEVLEGSLLRISMEWFKKLFGFPMVPVYGRGLFQDRFGIVPLKHPLNTVTGLPIDVKKVENPTQEDIDSLHKLFVEKLTELFEEYKYKFEESPETCKLAIV